MLLQRERSLCRCCEERPTGLGRHDLDHNVGPDSISEFSSYDVLDSLVDYYMDTDMYPNLNVSSFVDEDHCSSRQFQVVVIAGHSAGAQMAQRYIALRNSVKNDDKLHYWIGLSLASDAFQYLLADVLRNKPRIDLVAH